MAWACTRATAAAAVHLCCLQMVALRVSSPQVAALRESSTCPTDSAWGTSLAPVSHSLGWRESVGRVARTRQVLALKSSSRLVPARARGREPCGLGSARRPLSALRLEGSSLRDWLQAGVLELDMQRFRSRSSSWSLSRTRRRWSRVSSGSSSSSSAAVMVATRSRSSRAPERWRAVERRGAACSARLALARLVGETSEGAL